MEKVGSTQVSAPLVKDDDFKAAASWAHTLIVLAALGIWAYFGKLRADHLRIAQNVDHIHLYLRSMPFEWLLLGFVLFGLWLRKTPFRVVLGERWRSIGQVAQDLGLGIVFLVGSLMT